MSSSASTSSSSDSEGPSNSPAPKQKVLKRKRQLQGEAPSDSDDTSSSSHSEREESEDEEDTPALSHAERRRQKKKEEKAHRAEVSSAKKRKLHDGSVISKPHKSASASKKRQNSIWVGNLDFKTTPENLRGFFDGVGEITRIHMPMKIGKKGENMGFAYVDFASPDQKVIAITLSETDFQGRRLLIKDGDDFSGRPAPVKIESQNETSADPEDQTTAKSATSTGNTGLSKTAQKILKAQKQPAAPTLFLGNLGFGTTEKSILRLFEAHRKLDAKEGSSSTSKPVDKWIRKIRLGTFEDSGNCKGWAFVDFTSTEHATAVLVNPRNHRLDGRNLVVEYASAEAVRRGGGGPRPKVDEGLGPGQRRRSAYRGDKPNRGIHPTGRDGNGDGDREDRRVSRPPKVEAGRQDAVANARPQVGRGLRDHGDNAGYRGVKGRSTPGAALAMAKRESAAIVTSKGQKITF